MIRIASSLFMALATDLTAQTEDNPSQSHDGTVSSDPDPLHDRPVAGLPKALVTMKNPVLFDALCSAAQNLGLACVQHSKRRPGIRDNRRSFDEHHEH